MSKNPVQRLLERRDFLSLLLAPSDDAIRNATTNNSNKINSPKINSFVHVVDIASLPALEFKSLLSALSGECKCTNSLLDFCEGSRRRISAEDQCNTAGSSTSFENDTRSDLDSKDHAMHSKKRHDFNYNSNPHPRKKAKRELHNNHHSILRFIERSLDQRYHSKHIIYEHGNDQDNKFLEDELRSFFGTNDVLFRDEEEIVCLAFEIALDAIGKCVDMSVMYRSGQVDDIKENTENSMVTTKDIFHENKERQKLKEPPQLENMNTTMLHSGIIETSLRVIDSVVNYDRKERMMRSRLHEPKNSRQAQVHSVIVDGRKKIQKLLHQNERKRYKNDNDKAATKGQKSQSIIEEQYPKEWLWLDQFKAKYALRHSSNSANTTSSAIQVTDAAPENPSTEHHVGKKEYTPKSGFVILRRRIETVDDFSLSSDDDEIDEPIINSENNIPPLSATDENNLQPSNELSSHVKDSNIMSSSQNATDSAPISAPAIAPLSPRITLDQEAYTLRLVFLDMPPAELASAQVVSYATESIGDLLRRWGDLDGTSGISRCGDVIVGGLPVVNVSRTKNDSDITEESKVQDSQNDIRFPLNDVIVSSIVKEFLTDATGALRAKAFLRAFVLPLLAEMNPMANTTTSGTKNEGQPASRVLSSLLTSLACGRPKECVESVLVPALLMEYISTPAAKFGMGPNRFQCELISRVLRGKDALPITAIALLIEQLLPIIEEPRTFRGGMKWTETSIPLVTACLNRQPLLSDEVVAKLADQICYYLPPTSPLSNGSAPQSMEKSMKFSTLFHALVTKFGNQLKSAGKVDSLKDAATRLNTFMKKSIGTSLKKL